MDVPVKDLIGVRALSMLPFWNQLGLDFWPVL